MLVYDVGFNLDPFRIKFQLEWIESFMINIVQDPQLWHDIHDSIESFLRYAILMRIKRKNKDWNVKASSRFGNQKEKERKKEEV